ncbi:hypothetical protein M3182_23515 [Mesobacillus maritimus]|uniref:hypothetical protein n=1 Tax=Mesobacillus maritimus TaxID=1643336 RepID=UPI00203E1510|nr:hypothetical protein [Mesobacillus maritimus]MCM3588648.1 hypothetical protein [Mesobacillus maritimus]MCM3671829.1 hypothetical protein [Mesobacillus maritimus]
MTQNHLKQRNATAEDLNLLQQVTTSGYFILLDVIIYLIFFVFMVIYIPASIYVPITILFHLYLIISLTLHMQIKRTQ